MSSVKYSQTDNKTYTPKRIRKKSGSKNKFLAPVLVILCFAIVVSIIGKALAGETKQISNPKVAALAEQKIPSWIQQKIIPKNSDSRRREYLEDLTGIVIHYVGNPGTTARQNRDYYANPGTEVNSHFLVGLDGEMIQCLPLEEKSSASNERNRDTISIEVCHPDEEGKFSDVTYDAVVRLTAWLCQISGLDESQVIRHYDVTGKACPLYYVEHQDAWDQFKLDLKKELDK